MKACHKVQCAHALRRHKAVIIAVLCASVAGCGRHAPSGQTVATVNGENITQSELNIDLSAAGLTASSPAQARNQVLQSVIDRTLVDQQARKDGVDKTPEFVLIDKRAHDILLAQRAIQAASANPPAPPTDSDINDYLDKHPGLSTGRAMLTIDQVKFAAPRSTADVKALAPAKTMDQLISILQAQSKTFEHGQITVDSAAAPEDMLARLRKTTSGEPLVIVQGPIAVANVLVSEKPSTASSSDTMELAKKRLMSERAQAALRQHEMSLRQDAKIQYAPGFAPRPSPAGKTAA